MNLLCANGRGALRPCSVALTSAMLFLGAASALAETLPGSLVDAAWLEEHLDEVTLLDVRADVDSFLKRSTGGSVVNPCGAGVKGKEAEPVSGHIDGAILVRWSLLTEQREVDGQETDGWLPPADDFARLMQKSGVDKGAPVVITFKGERAVEAAMATRLYYTLKYFGHDNLAILDGGTAAWLRSGREVEFGRSSAKRGDFEAGPGRPELLASAEEVQTMSQEGKTQLVDAREPAGYLGVAAGVAGVDPRWSGHIPGARNLPMTLLSNDVGPVAVFFDADTQRKAHELMGIDPGVPTTTYCNTGVMASLSWYVLSERLGNSDVRLYDGSMQDWTVRDMPVNRMQGL